MEDEEDLIPLLSEQDKTSALWAKLVAHYAARLLSLREQNDTPKDEGKTAVLRGRIMQIKEFLSLGDDDDIQESDDHNY